jgi:hypothetical protein
VSEHVTVTTSEYTVGRNGLFPQRGTQVPVELTITARRNGAWLNIAVSKEKVSGGDGSHTTEFGYNTQEKRWSSNIRPPQFVLDAVNSVAKAGR